LTLCQTIEELVLADDPCSMLGQVQHQVEDLRLHRDGFVVLSQLEAGFVELEVIPA
jgi:hypothetical protein